jgi:hypothetical protein
VGVTASFDAGDASDGLISNMYYEGELILEKADGEKVNALCDTSLIGDIRGGNGLKLHLTKISKNGRWLRSSKNPNKLDGGTL